MYKEYACYDESSLSSVRSNIFEAIKLGANGISVPLIFLPNIADLIPIGINLSCPIDYPCGSSDTQLRNHAIIKAIHNKALSIDLVVQLYYLINNKIAEFSHDLSSAQKICIDHNVTLRVMIDYRNISENIFSEVCSTLNILKVEYAFASLGHFADDNEENILLCHKIQKEYGINAIANASIYLPSHYALVQDAKIFGVRWHNITAMQRCLK